MKFDPPRHCQQRTREYWEMTRERGQLKNEQIGDRLKAILGAHRYSVEHDGICLTCTGSDGRLEKGHISKPEIMIYQNRVPKNLVGYIESVALGLVDEKLERLVEQGPIDVKDIIAGNMSYADNNPATIFPSRIFDSFYLCGDPTVLVKAKVRLIAELRGPEGSRLSDRVKRRLRDTRNSMNTGTKMWHGQRVTDYDLNEGVAYFQDIKDVNLRSFKSGPLRFVQTAMERALVQLARTCSDPKEVERVIAKMPTPTVEKFGHLHDAGIINMAISDISEVVDCYITFLQLYHISERMAKSGQTTTEFDKQEAKERIDAILRIIGSGIPIRIS